MFSTIIHLGGYCALKAQSKFQLAPISASVLYGNQQTALPQQIFQSYSFIDAKVNAPITIFKNQLAIGGRLSIINGIIIPTATGISVEYKKPIAPNFKKPVSIKKPNLDSLGVKHEENLNNKLEKLKKDSIDPFYTKDAFGSNTDMFRLNDLKPEFEIHDSLSSKHPDLKPDRLLKSEILNKQELNDYTDSLIQFDSLDIVGKKLQKANRLISKVEMQELKLGLAILNVSPLIATGTSYQGIQTKLKVNNQLYLMPSVGITNRLPSLTSLIRQPQLISGSNNNLNYIEGFGNSNMQLNSLVFNQDINNILSSNLFVGLQAGYSTNENSEVYAGYYRTSLHKTAFLDRFSSNLFHLGFKRTVKWYKVFLEVANSSPITGTQTTPDDSIIVSSYKNALAPAIQADLEANISRSISIGLHYRNLSNAFYSPIQWVNNNIISNTGISFNVNYKTFQSKSAISLGRIRLNSVELPNNSISQSITLNVKEYLSLFINGSINTMKDSTIMGRSKQLSAGYNFTFKKNRNKSITMQLLHYNFTQLVNTDSMLNKLLTINGRYFHRISTMADLIVDNEYALTENVNYFNSRAIYKRKNQKNKGFWYSGLAWLSIGSNKWINALFGAEFQWSEKLKFSLNGEKSMISNERNIFSGQINIQYIF